MKSIVLYSPALLLVVVWQDTGQRNRIHKNILTNKPYKCAISILPTKNGQVNQV
jgi:hypothetical protein